MEDRENLGLARKVEVARVREQYPVVCQASQRHCCQADAISFVNDGDLFVQEGSGVTWRGLTRSRRVKGDEQVRNRC